MLVKCCALLLSTLIAAARVGAQTPGDWRYTISTDLSNIPIDMRVNFPTIRFSVCRSADDFASGRAFALQTLAGSEARCPSTGFVRSGQPDGKSDSLQFDYACDGGKTLSGLARGQVSSTRFKIELESRYLPAVSGVEVVKQTMAAVRTGPCKAK